MNEASAVASSLPRRVCYEVTLRERPAGSRARARADKIIVADPAAPRAAERARARGGASYRYIISGEQQQHPCVCQRTHRRGFISDPALPPGCALRMPGSGGMLATTVLFLLGDTTLAATWAPAHPQLLTRWASEVTPDNAHSEHPRPDAFRAPDSWVTLNGLWDADSSPANLTHPPFSPAVLPQQILVPYPFEAALSGIRELPKHHYMWYRRSITVPATKLEDGARVLLKFEAVDWQSEVYVNGRLLGSHSGGYDGFEYDITAELAGKTTAEVVVGVCESGAAS